MHIFINMDNDYYTKMKNMTGLKTSLKKLNIAITIELDALADKFNRIKMENDINDFIEKIKRMKAGCAY